MSSRALKEFETTYRRGYELVSKSVVLWRIVTSNEDNYEPTVEEFNNQTLLADMARSGIVTAVAAMDRYYTSRFSECVTPILKHQGPSDGLVDLLSKSGLTLKDSLELIHAGRPHRRIGTYVRRYFDNFTTQKFHVIDELFSSIGLAELTDHAQNKAKRRNLKTSVTKLIRRRHLIVHGGDLNSHGKLHKVDYKDILSRLQNLKNLVGRSDEIIESRLKACKKRKRTSR